MRNKVGVIVYDKFGKLLLVEGLSGKISLPKGDRKSDETELEGALREAQEETGIHLKDITYISQINLVWGTYFLYRLPTDSSALDLQPQAEEVAKILWKEPGSKWMRKADLNCDLASYVKSL